MGNGISEAVLADAMLHDKVALPNKHCDPASLSECSKAQAMARLDTKSCITLADYHLHL